MKFFKNLQINALVTAIVYIVLGVLFILMPDVVSQSIAIIVAAALLVAGAVYIIDYFRRWDIEYRSNGLAIGILMVFAAVFLFLQRDIIAAIIPLLLGFAVIVSGTIKLQNAIVLSRVKDKMWVATLVLSLLCLVLGILIMANPFTSLNVLIILIGVSLLISGLSDLVIIFMMSRKAGKIEAAGHGHVRDVPPPPPSEPPVQDA